MSDGENKILMLMCMKSNQQKESEIVNSIANSSSSTSTSTKN